MSSVDLDVSGTGAPPRSNGELIFDEPWESRIFGAAVALHEQGVLDFEEFRSRLVTGIEAWEGEHGVEADGFRYYGLWLQALERTVVEQGLATTAELVKARAHVEHEREHDHDHLP